MSKTPLILSLAALLLAVVSLVMVITGKPQAKPAIIGSMPGAASDSTGKGIVIVYVHTDSVMEQYEFFTALRKQLEDQDQRARNDAQKKQDAFRQKVVNFQQKMQNAQQRIGSMSELERTKLSIEFEQEEKALAEEEAKVMAYSEQLGKNLADKEEALQKQLNDKLNAFLEIYCAERGYDFVLTQGALSSVLYGNKQLNVTRDVIRGLNEAYAQEKQK